MMKTSLIPLLFAVAAGPATAGVPVATGHYTEYACTFGSYGSITIHEGGVGATYIIVRGRKYPSTGGENFVQSDEDDGVAVLFDRRGMPSYRGEIPGRNCRVTRR